MGKIYTAEQIINQDHKKSLWIVIHGNVYDLTKFYKEHPGGEDVLLELAGKDGSKCFDSIGHTVEAIALRDVLKIGELEEGAVLEIPEAKSASKESTEPQDENWHDGKQDEEEKSLLWRIVTIAVVFYAFIIYYLWFW